MKGEEILIDHDGSKAEKGTFLGMYGTHFIEAMHVP
jgi:hypothetical protein